MCICRIWRRGDKKRSTRTKTATSQPASRSKRCIAGDEGSPRKTRQKASEAPKHGTRTIAVIVGENESARTYDVHEDLLVDHSDFFRSALRGECRKVRQRSVSLPDDEPEVFELFYQYIYTGQVFIAREGEKVYEDEDRHLDNEWERLFKSWVLGNRIFSTSLKDAVVDCMAAKTREERTVPAAMFRSVYADGQSSKSSQIRKLLVDYVVYVWNEANMLAVEDKLQECPKHLFDVALALVRRTRAKGEKGEAPYRREDFHYHEHVAEGKPCYKTLF